MPPEPLPHGAYPAITDYGLIGDGHSAALVSSQGSIEWWCPRRFDASSVFARILDRGKGGHFATGIRAPHRREVRYLPRTNVLESTLISADTRIRLLTAMPHEEADHEPHPRRIVRVVECEEGEGDVTIELHPAFDHARASARLEQRGPREARATPAEGDHQLLRLRASAQLPEPLEEGVLRTTLRMRAGDRHAFILDWAQDDDLPEVRDPLALADDTLEREVSFWRAWSGRCRYEGPYRDEVVRSILALKLMQYVPTGAFVAAPTAGLPERPGGTDNYDYRYSWLRDGSFIVMAFDTLGYDEEVLRFRRWLASVIKRDSPDRVQMLYRVDGGRDLHESRLETLEGYRRAHPVLLGNKASEQQQLDTYGEVMLCYHRAPEIFDEQGEELWPALHALAEWVSKNWGEKDSGIWERRHEHRQYVYSKAMAWIALDHGLQIAEKNGFDAPWERWRQTRDDIHEWLVRDGYDAKRGGFCESKERRISDGANLLLPLFGVIEFDDERLRATIERTRQDLDSHGLMHRHLMEQREGTEGAFLAVNFWLAHDLAHVGEHDLARRYFENALATAGPLGLLSEEADAVTREPLGNYPQALSHLSLILAAYAIGHAGTEGGGREASAPEADVRSR